MLFVYIILTFLAFVSADTYGGTTSGITVSVLNNATNDFSHDKEHGHKGVQIAEIHYNEVRDPLIFTIVVLLTALCKVVYHHAESLSSKVPESCILVILGVLFGLIIEYSGIDKSLPEFFSPHHFFLFLLPPITLEAAYSLHDRTLLENIGSILLFAIVGTVVACFVIGLSMYGLAGIGAMGVIKHMSFMEYMVFAALIVAVDPVAVLAVFSEIGVNNVLYFIVFGESLLNDGVTVVLYGVFQELKLMDEIGAVDIAMGLVRFLVVCLGGLSMGVLAGLVTAILTKYTTHVKVIEPIIVYSVAYLGFLLCELFTFSGIISMIGCGLAQKQYAFHNISDRARSSVNYFSKVISNISEIIIFLFLGLSLAANHWEWHTGFALWAVLLCLVIRFVITFAISFFINWNGGLRKISLPEQFMIAYGGLRGAVCFSLVLLLEEKDFPQKPLFVTSTFAVILFTVFLQGTTIKPLVYRMRIGLMEDKDETMFEELHASVTDQLMAGLEHIIGDRGHNHLRESLREFDDKYLKPFFIVKKKLVNPQLQMFYENLLLREHYKHLELSGAKAEQPEELRHIDSALILSALGEGDEEEDDDFSDTESTTPSEDTTGDAGSDLGHSLNLPTPDPLHTGRRGSTFVAPLASAHGRRGSIQLLQRLMHNEQDVREHPVLGVSSSMPNSSGGKPSILVEDPSDSGLPNSGPVRRRSRSMSIAINVDTVKAHDLRDLIEKNQRTNMNAWKEKYDPDRRRKSVLNLETEIKTKNNSNRRLSIAPYAHGGDGHAISTHRKDSHFGGTRGSYRRRQSTPNGNTPKTENQPTDNDKEDTKRDRSLTESAVYTRDFSNVNGNGTTKSSKRDEKPKTVKSEPKHDSPRPSSTLARELDNFPPASSPPGQYTGAVRLSLGSVLEENEDRLSSASSQKPSDCGTGRNSEVASLNESVTGTEEELNAQARRGVSGYDNPAFSTHPENVNIRERSPQEKKDEQSENEDDDGKSYTSKVSNKSTRTTRF